MLQKRCDRKHVSDKSVQKLTEAQAYCLEDTFKEPYDKVTEFAQNVLILIVFILLERRKCGNDAVWMLFEQMLPQKSEIFERALNDP